MPQIIMKYLWKNPKGGFYCTIEKNGRVIWRTSESYTRRRGALRAMEIAAEAFGGKFSRYDYMDNSYN